jgi:hypothetical protein
MKTAANSSWERFLDGYVPEILVGSVGSLASMLLPNDRWKIWALLATLVCLVTLSIIGTLLRKSQHRRFRVMVAAAILPLWLRSHVLVHFVRNTVVRSTPPVPALELPIILTESERATVQQMLQHTRDIFLTVVKPGVNIMVTARELRCDGRFHTFARAGEANPCRSQTSKPLGPNDATIRTLLERLRNNAKCVILTGSVKGELEWTPQPNDQLGEDKSVLMGAVLIKNPEGQEFSTQHMKWVLCICADRENAFDSACQPLMQVCLDLLSLYANLVARKDALCSASPDSLLCANL